MIIYWIIFAIALFLTNIADKNYKKNKRKSYILAVVCVIILSVFAALRALSVGIDLSRYGIYMFNRATRYSNIFTYLQTFQKDDIGYYIFNYVIARFTDNIHWLLFMHQFIISSIIYIIAFKEKEKKDTNLALTIFIYLTLLYNMTFNIIRQALSIVIIVYSFYSLEEKKYLRYYILLLIASSFHRSTLILCALPLVNLVYKNKKSNLFKTIVMSAILIISFYFIEEIFALLSQNIDVFENYSVYISASKTNLSVRFLRYKILMLITVLFFYFNTPNKSKNHFLMFMSVLDVVFYSLAGFIRYGYRISYFFIGFYIIFIPRMLKNIKTKQNRIIFSVLIIMILIGYWYFRNVIMGYDGTIPYSLEK